MAEKRDSIFYLTVVDVDNSSEGCKGPWVTFSGTITSEAIDDPNPPKKKLNTFGLELEQPPSPVVAKFALVDVRCPADGWSAAAMSFLKKELVGLSPWKASRLWTHEGCQGVRVFYNNYDLLATQVLEKNFGVPNLTYERGLEISASFKSRPVMDFVPQISKSCEKIEAQRFKFGSKEEVVVTFIKDPSFFKLQLLKDLPTISEISSKLSKANPQEILTGAQKGDGCAVLVENEWHRATVLETGQKIKLLLVDDGAIEIVEPASVKVLDRELAKIPAKSHLCCLHGWHRARDLPPKSNAERFQKFLNRQLTATFTGQLASKDQEVIYLRDGATNISEQLGGVSATAGHGSIGTKDVIVVYGTSPSRFWIQGKWLHESMEILNARGSTRNVEAPVVGEIYAVKHKVFGGYFRGKVVSHHDGFIKTVLIDFGDELECSMDNVFMLLGAQLFIPAISCEPCSLKQKNWSDGDIAKFLDVTSKAAVFQATFGGEVNGVRQIDSLRLLGETVEFLDSSSENSIVPSSSTRLDSSCENSIVASSTARLDVNTVAVEDDAIPIAAPHSSPLSTESTDSASTAGRVVDDNSRIDQINVTVQPAVSIDSGASLLLHELSDVTSPSKEEVSDH